MASAKLQFRRGTFLNDLVSSEPFFDDINSLIYIGTAVSSSIVLAKLNETNSGSFSISGDISSSNATFTGTVNITNDIVIGGSIILGDNPVDEISLNGVLSGSMIPTTNSVFNIGTPSSKWNTIYAVSASFDDLTATAVPYSGITGKPTLVSGSSQISVSGSVDFDPSRWEDHSSISILSGNGLSGGGTISTSQTLTLDTGSTHFIDGVTAIAPTLPSGLISGSNQLTGSFVSTTGTTVDNQIAIWTADGNLEGSNNFFWNGARMGIGTNDPRNPIHILTSGTSSITTGIQRGFLVTDQFGPRLLLEDTGEGINQKTIILRYENGLFSVNAINDAGDSWINQDLWTVDRIGNTTQKGNSTSNSFIKIGATSDDVLLGDGTTTSLASLGGIPSGVVSGSSQLTGSFDTRYVNTVGTPVNNQVGVWTGDGTLEGDSRLLFRENGLDTQLFITGSGGDDTSTRLSIQNSTGSAGHFGALLEFVSSGWGEWGIDVDGQRRMYGAASALRFVAGPNGVEFRDSSDTTSLLTVDNSGNITGSSFIKDGATADDILLGDGTTTTLSGLQTTLPSGVVSGSDQLSGSFLLNIDYQTDSSSFDARIDGVTSTADTYNNTYYEVPVGTKNGINTTFTVSAGEFRESSLVVYLNGQALFTGSGILETNPLTGTFDFEVGLAPSASDAIHSTYEVGTFSTASFFNLNDPTSSVGGHILPTVTETYDLGSNSLRWRDLYLSGSTIYLGEGQVSFNPSGSLEIKNQSNEHADLVVRNVLMEDSVSGKRARISYDGTQLITDEFDSSANNLGKLPSSLTGSFSGSFIGDGSGLTGVVGALPSGVVSGSSQLTSSYDTRYALVNTTYRSYVDSTGGSLVGIQDGINTNFTSSQGSYLSGSVLAFVAGYPYSNGNGLVETNPASGVITFDTAPENFDIIILQYSN